MVAREHVRSVFSPLTLSDGLCLLGLTVGFLSPFFAHPALATGVWRNTEGVNAVVLAGAVLSLAGLTLRPSRRHLTVPPLLLFLVLAGWSLLTAPFASYPLTSVLGPPQTMYGVLWLIAQAAFLGAALTVAATPRLFRAAVLCAAAAALVVVWFNLSRAGWLRDLLPSALVSGGTLLGFNEYLAYPALALALVGAACWQRGGRYGSAAVLTVAGLLLITAGNRTAWAAAILMVLTLLLARLTRRRWRAKRPALWAAVTATLSVQAVIYAIIRFSPVNSLPPSLESRRILFAALDPGRWMDGLSWLTGKGWGHYEFQLYAVLPSTGVSLTDPQWIDFGRDEFHSHHAVLEALFSAGLPAAVLVALIPAAVVLAARPALRPLALAGALAMALIDSLWFQMPQTMAFTALGLAALVPPFRKPATVPPDPALKPARIMPVAVTAALSMVLTAGVGVGGFWQARTSILMDEWRTCLRRGSAVCPATLPVDPRQSELGLSVLIGETVAALEKRGWPRRPSDRLEQVLLEASRRCRPDCPMPLARSVAAAQAVLAFRPEAARLFSASQWDAAVVRLTETAPTRLDNPAVYFNWLLLNGQADRLGQILAGLPAAARQSPVYGWFSGALLLGAPDPADTVRGLSIMRAALKAGVDHQIPVEQDIRAALEQIP